MRPNTELYFPRMWALPEFESLRRTHHLGPIEAVQLSVAIRKRLLQSFTLTEITFNRLDNPFMAEHARNTIIASAKLRKQK